MGGGARGVKIAIGGNGASVCSRSVAFFEVFAESDISARKKIKKTIKKLAGNSSAGPPNSGDILRTARKVTHRQIHRYHAVVGANSTTMVMMFVGGGCVRVGGGCVRVGGTFRVLQ